MIYIATRSGHYDIVELILKSGCVLDFSKDRSTPMHCAAYYGFHDIIPLLFKYGVPIKFKNKFGHFPEEEACTEAIKSLFKNSQEDMFHKLVENLIDHKLALGTLNMSFDD